MKRGNEFRDDLFQNFTLFALRLIYDFLIITNIHVHHLLWRLVVVTLRIQRYNY